MALSARPMDEIEQIAGLVRVISWVQASMIQAAGLMHALQQTCELAKRDGAKILSERRSDIDALEAVIAGAERVCRAFCLEVVPKDAQGSLAALIVAANSILEPFGLLEQQMLDVQTQLARNMIRDPEHKTTTTVQLVQPDSASAAAPADKKGLN